MQPLLGEEQEKPRRSKAYLAFFLGAVVLSVAAFAFMLIGPLSGLETPADTGHSLTRLLHKLDSSSRIAHFVEHKDYMSLDPQYDGLWSDDLLTPNGGYVIMDKETNKTDKMGISMFHQLHCLAMIRDEMQYLSSIIDAVKEAAIFKGEWEPKEPVERRHGHKSNMDLGNPGHHGQTHVLHCFDYLRQTIRCLADSTIERPKLYPDGTPFIDGMGDRKCKNWDLLYGASTTSDDEPMMADDLR